ncbi:MAG TPA: branched-chain amino acid ABC transporter permease [Micromonosporaceae bacterium]|nr:branched-chain amino acid ABC transporter permease [Micromonosporaceae bacterium]
MTVHLSSPAPSRRGLPRHLFWPVGYAVAALLVFLLLFAKHRGYLSPAFSDFLQQWLSPSSIIEAVVWVICALGLNTVVGYAGLLDLGYVAFWAIGGYTAGWLMSEFFYQVNVHVLGSVPQARPGIHLSFWMVLAVGAALCALFGALIGAPTLRLRSDYLALVTLGFGEIIPQVFTNGENIGGFNLSNGTKGIVPVDPISVGGFRLGPFDLHWKYLIFVGLAVLIAWISLRLREGRLGRAWLAIREDEVAASAMGVPLMRVKLAAYAIGALAGGIGGVAFATHVNSVSPERFNFSISIILLAMVVLGGMGNVWGVILGALVLAWVNSTGLQQLGNALNDLTGRDINLPSYNYLIFGSVLVLMMLFRREGFLPESRTRLVLREHGREGISGEATLDYEAADDMATPGTGEDIRVVGEEPPDAGEDVREGRI